MLNKAFRNNGFVISVGNGLGSVLFPCPPPDIWLRDYTSQGGVNWWGCGNYGWNQTSSATYAYYTDGNCGEYSQLNGTWSLPSGSVLYDTGCCQVIWDGSNYYVNDNCNPCSPSGTPTGNTRAVNINEIYWEGCQTTGWFSTSYEIETEYNDGNCQTYWMPTGSYTADNGTQIYSYNDCCYVYYDAYNSPYYTVSDNCSQPPCPDAGATSNTRIVNEQTLSWSGCSNSGNYTYAYTVEREYADGMCNTYWSFESSWTAMNGDMIFDNGCCTVTYSDFGSYNVNDNCGGGCTSSGTPTGNTQSANPQTLNWSGCGDSGSFTYSYETSTEYHDGACSTYWVNDGSWNADNGAMIYDNGCCTVTYSQYGSYSVNDNCGDPPPPDYPPAGTILSSSSSDETQNISFDGFDMNGSFQTASTDITIGTSFSTEIADGAGGSIWESGTNYISDGTLMLTPYLGGIHMLDWTVTDGGGSYNGSVQVGLDVPLWIMSGSAATQNGTTSFLDKFNDGYLLFETNEWFNGDANVKTRVEYQNGGGYITTTITF
jgi:hypothetical protein